MSFGFLKIKIIKEKIYYRLGVEKELEVWIQTRLEIKS
jgi:hypothetical protein